MNYKEIIALVNKRYVLLKQKEEEYGIYDKLQGAFLFVNDPIINHKELIKELKRRSSKVYDSITELPSPIQEPIDWTKNNLDSKNLIIRKMYDDKGIMTGVAITYHSNSAIKNIKEKELIEKRIIDFIHDNIFKNEAISTYVESYRDIASVIAINNINELTYEYGLLKF